MSCRIRSCDRERYEDELCEPHYYAGKHESIYHDYPRPLNEIMLLMMNRNCEEWLTGEKREKLGAESVREQGLTRNQKKWADEIAGKLRNSGLNSPTEDDER